MTRVRPNRALAGLLAAAVLLSSAGCGLCFGPLGCTHGLECCIEFECHAPKDCPTKSKVSYTESELATSSEADEPTP